MGITGAPMSLPQMEKRGKQKRRLDEKFRVSLLSLKVIKNPRQNVLWAFMHNAKKLELFVMFVIYFASLTKERLMSARNHRRDFSEWSEWSYICCLWKMNVACLWFRQVLCCKLVSRGD